MSMFGAGRSEAQPQLAMHKGHLEGQQDAIAQGLNLDLQAA